ncbi:TPA: dTDP-4-dehydrorhamnose reductase [Candidatus Sumerlaeota bacterium]|jgi:dTDP-4-dehydrorhamnose reductase|nr:dTDP-4-dehydrorhamnose reductase [Candidatus Sumerlaeota bacterium]
MSETYLVTGSAGMLGSAVVECLRKQEKLAVGVDRPDADLSQPDAVRELILSVRPAHVIHCAAYTNVDKAESEPDLACAGNTAATQNIAHACVEVNASVLMVGTDYVFGDAPEQISLRQPIPVSAPTAPQGVYARTKLAAEQALAATLPRHQIVRTAWLFGPRGRHFVGIILDRLQKGLPLRVVNDQVGSPTYTLDLAERLVALSESDQTGIFHLTNSGYCSWHAFACTIAELSGFDPCAIESIPSSAWPSPVTRPAWSVLDCERAWGAGAQPMRSWREALVEYLNK